MTSFDGSRAYSGHPHHGGGGSSGRTLGIIVIVVAVAFLGIVFIAASGGGGGGETVIVCDLVGRATGTVHDDNILQVKDVRNVQIALVKRDCHEKSIFDVIGLSVTPLSPPPPAATIGEGSVDIRILGFDGEGQQINGGTAFTVKTANFQVEANFDVPLKFSNVRQGESYSIKTFSSWKGANNPEDTKTITVN